jgi:hypothetical protein
MIADCRLMIAGWGIGKQFSAGAPSGGHLSSLPDHQSAIGNRP